MTISTLVIDDSATYRKILAVAASDFPELSLVGHASSGDLALQKLSYGPVQLVFCDVNMPGMDGVDTLLAIKKLYPETIVVMMSGVTTRSAETTIRALEHGALDFIEKPTSGTAEENMARLKADIALILRLVRIRFKMAPGISFRQPVVPSPADVGGFPGIPASFALATIGASTGGPEALAAVIPQLPANLPVPVLVVQHMPHTFTRFLAESLDRVSKLRVIEAEHGSSIEAGTVYLAPGGRHMIVENTGACPRIAIKDDPPENSCRPSVDVLLRSVAAVYGRLGVVSVMLTGLGSDGLEGVRALKRNGCLSITQSAASCVVYGMPRAVADGNLSDVSLPLEKIAEEITARLRC